MLLKKWTFALILICTLTAVFVSSALMASSDDWKIRSGTVANALLQPDGTEVVLDNLMVDYTLGSYTFAKDIWVDGGKIPILTSVPLQNPWSIEVTGNMATVDGTRILIATDIRLYTCPDGTPFILMPKGTREPNDWPYMQDLMPQMRGMMNTMEEGDPPPPEELPPAEPSSPPAYIEGTIPWAKTQTGTVTLTGKVVTAVFFLADNVTVDYFYISESDRLGGIKVDPVTPVPVEAGDLVNVTGSIESTGAECYIDASNVQIVGSSIIPKNLGMAQKFTCAGALGAQPALYIKSSDPAVQGSGLSAVGGLVRAWGKVTAIDGNTCFVDDGSMLKSTVGTTEQTGIRLMLPETCTYQVDGYVSGITGILGGEMSDDTTPLPIPVVRVPKSNIFVSITSPSTGQLHYASGASTATLKGIATSPGTGIASVKVGFTATGLETAPTTWNAATYDAVSHTWTYSWSSPSDCRVWVEAYDYYGKSTSIYRDIDITSVNVIYVNSVRPDNTGNGTSWSLAKKTVTAALTAATSGTELWVAQGVYKENITLKSEVGVYGGFAPTDTYTETYREQRNWASNKTVLDGRQIQSVVIVPVGATSATTIDGFTIQNGIGYNSYYLYGAGIYCSNTSATIANNIIRGNSTNYGGGLYASGSNLTVVGNVFLDNSVKLYGGGIYFTNTNGLIANNTIINNTATGYSYYIGNGAGIYLASSSPSLTNNIIAFNNGGGIYKSGGTPTFTNNDVYGNSRYGKYDYSWTPIPTTDLINPTTGLSPDPVIPNDSWGDWHIAGNSPCRDPQGTALAVTMDKDIDAESRVNGNFVDIGADEWSGTDPAPVTPTIIFVKPSSQGGSDNNDGMSWSSAVATVQKGIDLAYNTGNCEVWIAAGTYVKTGSTNVKSFVKLYGGFAVGDNTKSARNWNTNQTILDGGASGAVVTINKSAGCVVDGFTIRNGVGTNGGAIYCYFSSATIMNNNMTGNTATYGGGIYCSSSSLEIRQNTIQSNTSSSEGGGMFCDGGSCPLVSGNRFIDNNGADHGGAIALEGSSTKPVIINNLFKGNHVAGTGGGAINDLEAVPWIINNTFVSNYATAAGGNPGYGGAIIVRGSTNPLIINNIFSNNTAVAGNSVACYAGATATILFCDAYSDISNTYAYHYSGCATLGQDCIYINPLFVNAVAGDYNIQIPTDSTPTPIDKGHNYVNDPQSNYYKVPLVDIENNTRPVNIDTVPDFGTDDAYTDMGAYEVHQ